MSCRYPHYVRYYALIEKVYQANAEDEHEAISELYDHYDPGRVQVIEVTTVNPDNDGGY